MGTKNYAYDNNATMAGGNHVHMQTYRDMGQEETIVE